MLKLNMHRPYHNEKTLQCPKCTKIFNRTGNLNKHIREVHDKDRPFICTICSNGCKTKSSLKLHMATHTKDYRFKCNICNAGFHTNFSLNQHQNVKHLGVRFTCLYCNKAYQDRSYLRAHVSSCHLEQEISEEQISCPICSRPFGSENKLKKHLKYHKDSEARNAICDICGRTVSNLRDHMRTHTGIKSFVCQTCGRGFTQKKQLMVHIRVHTKEKPYECEICRKSFTQKGTLTIHLRTHSGERPYRCHICSKGFISKSSLNVHKCVSNKD